MIERARMTDETLKESLRGAEELMYFDRCSSVPYEGGTVAWIESERVFSNGVFIRYIKDTKGERVEIGDRWRSRLMFRGTLEGSVLVWREAPARKGRREGTEREVIRDALLDLYGCVGRVRGACNRTKTL